MFFVYAALGAVVSVITLLVMRARKPSPTKSSPIKSSDDE